ncbi:hypothetical protein [Mammaliicoccus sp. E-M21]|uniref:hypothetical protein n=1 Tax=Mammaliicoccus sp. E-M21 TaxID=2898681 RepID=UPI001EFA49A5|nr:hypothetical protein [Mammaliicoccus sp. E-M21]
MEEKTLEELRKVSRKLGIEVHSYTMEGEFDLGKWEWNFIGRVVELYTVDSHSTERLMVIRNNCITECNKAKQGSEWIYEKHTGKMLFFTEWLDYFKKIEEILNTEIKITDVFEKEDISKLQKADPIYQEFVSRIVCGD